jgi:fibronectin-binding autotransporter adhesin
MKIKNPLPFILAAMMVLPVGAANIIFDNDNADGDFNNPVNWVGNFFPGAFDNAIVEGGLSATIAGSPANAFTEIWAGQTGAGTINITGGTVNANAWTAIGRAATGNMTISNATLNPTRLTVGSFGGGGNGTLTLNAGAIINASTNFFIGEGGIGTVHQNDGTVTVGGGDARIGANAGSVGNYNLTSGTLTSNVNFQIGASGTGTFTQTGGTFTQNGWTAVGRFGSGNGTANISGGLFLHNNTGTGLIIAEDGTGTMTVSGTGTVATKGTLLVGHNVNGTATLNVQGGTVRIGNVGTIDPLLPPDTITNPPSGARHLIVGADQTVNGTGAFDEFNNYRATMNVSGGQTIVSGELWIAQGRRPALATTSDPYPTLAISGGTITAENWLVVGRQEGQGLLNISGGTINKTGANHIILGSIGGKGTMNQTGGTITVAAGQDFRLGENNGAVVGTGIWNFSAGTTNVGGSVIVGWNTNSTGNELNLSGTANLTSNRFVIGQNTGSSGTVTMNGGTITDNGAGDSRIGDAAGSTGVLNLNSGTFTTNNNFQIGATGTGTMNQTGGTFTAAAGWPVVGRFGGSNGTLDISGGTFNQTANGNGFISGEDGTGTTTVRGTGILNTAGQLIVGNNSSSNGTLNVQTGGAVNVGTSLVRRNMTVGNNGTTTATANISGGTLYVSNELWIGQGAPANALDTSEMNITGGTVTVDNWLAVGRSNGRGILNLSGTGTLTKTNLSGGNAVLGSIGGTGTFNQSGGTFTIQGTDRDFLLGETGGTGTYNLSGGTANLGRDLLAGWAGNGSTGTVNISGTGQMNVRDPRVASGANTIGTLNITGNGILNSSGWAFIGSGTGSRGTLDMAGSGAMSVNMGEGRLYLGQGADSRAYVNIADTSTLQFGRAYWNNGNNSEIFIRQTGGSMTNLGLGGNDVRLGDNPSSFGYVNLTGGTFSTGNQNFQIGGSGRGVVQQSGGTLTTGSWPVVGRFGGSAGELTVSGGTFNQTGPGNMLIIGEDGFGVFTTSGTAQVTLSGTALRLGHSAIGSGIVNLRGGTVSAPAVSAGTGSSLLNFNGGTLQATASNANFINGVGNTFIHSGGAVIDTQGFTVTLTNPLLAPSGNGLSSISLATNGVDYDGAPLVTITGGGGSGATASAVWDPVTKTLTGITVTNPGTGYTSVPTVSLSVADASTAATVGTVSLAANTSGGLTKTGTGPLTLAAANTYQGATNIQQGSLSLGATGSINNSSSINIASGASFNVSGLPGASYAFNGSVTGEGSVIGSMLFGAGTQIAPGDNTGSNLGILAFQKQRHVKRPIHGSLPVGDLGPQHRSRHALNPGLRPGTNRLRRPHDYHREFYREQLWHHCRVARSRFCSTTGRYL